MNKRTIIINALDYHRGLPLQDIFYHTISHSERFGTANTHLKIIDKNGDLYISVQDEEEKDND